VFPKEAKNKTNTEKPAFPPSLKIAAALAIGTASGVAIENVRQTFSSHPDLLRISKVERIPQPMNYKMKESANYQDHISKNEWSTVGITIDNKSDSIVLVQYGIFKIEDVSQISYDSRTLMYINAINVEGRVDVWLDNLDPGKRTKIPIKLKIPSYNESTIWFWFKSTAFPKFSIVSIEGMLKLYCRTRKKVTLSTPLSIVIDDESREMHYKADLRIARRNFLRGRW